MAGATLGDGFNYWLGRRYRDRIRTLPFFKRQAPLLDRPTMTPACCLLVLTRREMRAAVAGGHYRPDAPSRCMSDRLPADVPATRVITRSVALLLRSVARRLVDIEGPLTTSKNGWLPTGMRDACRCRP
ncbi:MAG: hypothetical protein ABIR94_23950 [Rubrivivax sp.]